MCERCIELEKALADLVDVYIANIGTNSEFISCITPKPPCKMTFFERRESKVWFVWDNARELLGGKYVISKSSDKNKQ